MNSAKRQVLVWTVVLGCGLSSACPSSSPSLADHAACALGACAGGSASGASGGSQVGAQTPASAGKDAQATAGARAPNAGASGSSAASAGRSSNRGSSGATPSTSGASGTSTTASSGRGGSASPSSMDAGTPLANYSLVVDAPKDGDTVGAQVSVSGRAPGFVNVEVWDAMHESPPLGQAMPDANGAFSMTIDTTALASGATTWTVYAWDSAPGQSFNHTTNVALNLTIATSTSNPSSCSGQACSGHGSCAVSGGQAACSCDSGYHALGLSCIADASTGPGQPDPGMKYVPAGYSLKFSDEFNGSSVDTGTWNTLAPFGVQFFSDSHQQQAFVPEGVTIANGLATFTAKPSAGNANTNGQSYQSGSLTTNGTFTHGYFEARVSVPAGKGFWPAFWLTSSTRWPPEWDIFEIIDGVIYGYTHPVSGGKCSFVEGAAGSDSTYMISNVYGSFHIYGFQWTASDLYWYVDGVLTEHYAIDDAAGANDPFWLNVSLQVGGDWPKNPDSSTPFPSHMDVDYVRVYQQ